MSEYKIKIRKIKNRKGKGSIVGVYSRRVEITIDGIITRATIGTRIVPGKDTLIPGYAFTLQFDRQWSQMIRKHPDFEIIRQQIQELAYTKGMV